MHPIPTEHPFAQVCVRYQCTCELDSALGLSMLRFGDAQISFYGDTDAFFSAMSQKRYYKLIPKMVYLAKMGASPTFLVDRPMLWSNQMMKLECDRIVDPALMLTRFFALVPHPAIYKMKESANALVCGFRPTGFRYNSEGKGEGYALDISLAYDQLFVRRVFTLADMGEQFHLPKDVLLWMGEPGSAVWWNAMRDLALNRSAPIPELELPALDLF